MDGFISPGADRAARIRAAVTSHLSNATATWQGGEPFGVLFRFKPIEMLGSIGGTQVACGLLLSDAPGLDQGGVLVIDGQEWTVIEPVVADSSGWATVLLREGGNG